MQNDHATEITAYLNNENSLGPIAQAKLIKLIYSDLKYIAINRLAAESSNNTLTVTALVHEAFIRLKSVHSITWKNRRHYFGAAAEAMRRVLIDRARYHSRNCREAERSAIPLDEGLHLQGVKPKELLALNDALDDLEVFDKDLSNLVKLHYFVGLSSSEIADLYESSPRTISRRVQSARAWLLMQIQET